MPDLSRTIEIIFEGVDHLGSGLAAMGGGIENFAGRASAAAAPLAALTQGVIALDAAAVAMAVVIGTRAVQETSRFADSLYLVQKQLDDSGPSIETARSDIEALARQYGINANEVARSGAGFLGAGFDYQNSVGLMNNATQLMIAGDLDAQTATDALTRSIAGFRIPADEAAEGGKKIGDALNKIGDISSGSFNEIIIGFTDIAPTARDAGLSIEETAAWTAVLVDKFGSGSEAATALKSGLLQMLNAPKEAAEELQKLGVATEDAAGKQRDARDIINDLARATEGMTDNQRLQAAAIVFGKDAAGQWNALLGDWGKSLDYVSQMTDRTNGATNSMQREVDGKLRLLSTATAIASESWRQFLERIGARITAGDDLQSLVTSVGGLSSALSNALDSGAFDVLFNGLRDEFGSLKTYIDGIAAALPKALEGLDWSPVQDALREARSLFGGMFDGLDLTKPDDLRIALQGVVDGIGTLIQVTGGIVTGLQPLLAIIGSIARGFSELSPEAQTAVGYLGGVATVATALAVPVAAVGAAISALAPAMGLATRAILPLSAALGALEIGELVVALGQVPGVMNAQAEAAESSANAQQRLSDKLAIISRETGVTIDSMESLEKAVSDGTIKFNEANGVWEKADPALKNLERGISNVDEQMRLAEAAQNRSLLSSEELNNQYNKLAGDSLPKAGDQLSKNAELTNKNSDGVERLVFSHGRWIKATDDITKAMDDEAKSSAASKDALEKKAAETERMNRASVDFMIQWEKIQSSERVSLFEIKSKIDIAQIEADANRTVEAFKMMSSSFNSTETVLGKLLDLWGSARSNSDKNSISEWIEREYKIREDLAKTQQELIAAEIKRMEAQARMIEKGGMDVKISADGLEPDLAAFMFSVIDRVRVQVAGSYQEFLIGAGA